MSDDWIEWHGGDCPVPVGTIVQTRRLSGYVDGKHAVRQREHGGRTWQHGAYHDRGTDIIAYRVVPE